MPQPELKNALTEEFEELQKLYDESVEVPSPASASLHPGAGLRHTFCNGTHIHVLRARACPLACQCS